jgi:hypothetical protein
MHSRERTFPQRRRTPSFSSILLDTIDHSIDESKTDFIDDVNQHQHQYLYNQTTKHVKFNEKIVNSKQRMNLRQAVMIEDWMEKNSSSSSSECSSGGIFSSSETDSSYKKQRSRPQKHMNLNSEKQQQLQEQQKQNKNKKKEKQQGWEDGFTRTKLRALKIYDELNQKVKQPISPGSRIATFLSSIFNSHNVKKAKMCYVGAVEDVSFDRKSKSPSVSSFSRRSCMSKTPSKSNNGVKRSVRFYPVSVILGEDDSEQQKQRQQQLPSIRNVTRNSSVKEMKKINNVINMAKEKGAVKSEFDFRRFYDNGEDEDEDEDDDAVSYSSSDLFELDHLIGGERYQQELPVYETTNLETNKAIANGLCL